MLSALKHTGHKWCRISESFGYYCLPQASRYGHMAAAVRKGLESKPRYILPRFLYDGRGSRIFDQICKLPEYYQTRTESAILGIIRYELSRYMHDRFRLVELGSGAAVKTRHILDAMMEADQRPAYVPIDISDTLVDYAKSLSVSYPDLSITGIVDTYENGLDIVKEMGGPPNLITFFGSSLGNMTPTVSYEFLGRIRDIMGKRDMLLVGLDMVKDATILEAAYNDSAGITAKFNLNLLERLNREFDADFDVGAFSHYARYNQNLRRIEMYLRSDRDQTVHIPKANTITKLEKGELIHTENSYKYTITDIRTIADVCGFSIERLWRDDDERFSITLMSR